MTHATHTLEDFSNPGISSRAAISALSGLLGLIFALNAASVVAALLNA